MTRGRILLLLSVAILVIAMSAVWQLHPWVKAGRAMAIGTWKFGDYEFQVWQRKNDELFEPFATGLFVRGTNGHWQTFCLDHQDVYAPRIVLREQGQHIVVFRGQQRLGVFDKAERNFRRRTDGATLTGVIIASDPPGDWWVRR